MEHMQNIGNKYENEPLYACHACHFTIWGKTILGSLDTNKKTCRLRQPKNRMQCAHGPGSRWWQAVPAALQAPGALGRDYGGRDEPPGAIQRRLFAAAGLSQRVIRGVGMAENIPRAHDVPHAAAVADSVPIAVWTREISEEVLWRSGVLLQAM